MQTHICIRYSITLNRFKLFDIHNICYTIFNSHIIRNIDNGILYIYIYIYIYNVFVFRNKITLIHTIHYY